MPPTPTVKQRRLARKLKEARLRAGMTHDQAADALGCRQPKISKIENAAVTVNSDDVRTLAEAYGLDDTRVESLARLARESKRRGWWHIYADAMTEGAEDFMEMETEAKRIYTYEADVIPGLLQTQGYARAVIRVFAPELDEEVIKKRTEVRMKRQERLLNGDVSLWAVVDAGAIMRAVGGAQVHREQVRHLVTVAQHPSVTFQALPPEAGEHIAQGTPFACFTFPDGGGAVVIDHLAGTWCTEDQPIVDRYTLAGEHLRATALSTRDSLAWVRKVADSLG